MMASYQNSASGTRTQVSPLPVEWATLVRSFVYTFPSERHGPQERSKSDLLERRTHWGPPGAGPAARSPSPGSVPAQSPALRVSWRPDLPEGPQGHSQSARAALGSSSYTGAPGHPSDCARRRGVAGGEASLSDPEAEPGNTCPSESGN